jgi:tetratricopeptide (TPR) repeat protein
VGSAYAGLSLAACKLGDYDQAWEHCLTALQLLLEYQHLFWMFYALGTMALLLAQQAQVTQAIEIYSLIRRYNFVANSRWFQDVIGRHLDETAANALPATEVAAARKRGEAMQVWATVNQLLENSRLPV